MQKNSNYDKSNPKSIEAYAKNLVGQTFQDVVDNSIFKSDLQNGAITGVSCKRRKGALGNLLEELYFGYKANSDSRPDFPEAGVELKVSPFEKTKKGEIRAAERLVLTMINYNGPIEESLYDSHVWEKCKRILLVYYWRDKTIQDNLLYPIQYVSLFTPSEKDLVIIENDYKIIAQKIISGKAQELSESDTFYLGACTKGKTAETSVVNQWYPPHAPAKKRAFCFKNSYMTFVLNSYILRAGDFAETIVKDASELLGTTFADIVKSKINSYIGKTDKQLCEIFSRPYNNNKAQWTDLTYRMLGIRSNKAEEFRKANITVKVIRLEEKCTIRECMSLPPFKYKELADETWEESTLNKYFSETKFLFVVFKKTGDCYTLRGCQFWNMPYSDLNEIVRDGWKKVVKTIQAGIRLKVDKHKNGLVVKNNLPKKKDNAIIHVRPHTSKTYYEFEDGTIVANGSRANANQLPNSNVWMTTYSFWLNNDYIVNQLDDYCK